MSEHNDDLSVVATVNRDYAHYKNEEEINVLITQEEFFALIESAVKFSGHKLTKIDKAMGSNLWLIFNRK